MDFDKDIREYLENEFNYLGISYTPSKEIREDLLKLFTIQRKIIFPFPRQTEISKELQEKIIQNNKYSNEIVRIKDMFQKGLNVNFLQSKNLFNYHVHDDLVYDWNIYHLHLSFDRKDNNYFTKRTKEVLFVYIAKDKALLIDIAKHPPHDVFADKRLLETLDRNWSDVLIEVNDIVGLSHNPTTQDRMNLRKHNINEGIVEINGKYIFGPGLGQVFSGHSSEEVLKLNAFQRWINAFEKSISRDKEKVDILFMKAHNLLSAADYKIMFTNDGPQIWDANTNTCLLKYQEIIKWN